MKTGAALKDRTGAPLIFTPEVNIIEKGSNLEVTGIRAYKYPIDYVHVINTQLPYLVYREIPG